MLKNNISKIVENIVKKYKTRDPFELCDMMDIEIMPFAFNESGMKGYFTSIENQKIIVINSNLDDFMQKFVCAHELGHAILHSHQTDLDSFYISSDIAKNEVNANYFASELIVSDKEILDKLEDYDNYFMIASELGISNEAMDFKIRMMIHKGYKLNEFMLTYGDFLR